MISLEFRTAVTECQSYRIAPGGRHSVTPSWRATRPNVFFAPQRSACVPSLTSADVVSGLLSLFDRRLVVVERLQYSFRSAPVGAGSRQERPESSHCQRWLASVYITTDTRLVEDCLGGPKVRRV